MTRTVHLAIAILGLTALIGLGLWVFDVAPYQTASQADVTTARRVISFPLFSAGLGSLITAIIVASKRGAFQGTKSDMLPMTGILVVPFVALLLQILAPLSSLGLIGDNGANTIFLVLLATFFLIVGNFVVTVPMGSRLGFSNAWTLSHPTVWIKTHRFLGRNMVIAVLLVTPIAYILIPDNATWALIGAVIVVKVATYFYARNLSRQIVLKDEARLTP